MSPRDTDISDETLTAYLDGELSRPEADMVADALVDSPTLAARLAALEVPISELRPAFAQMLDDMPPGILPPSQTASAPQRRGGLIAAGLALVAGLGLGAFALPQAQPDWHDYVASYQALYVEDTLASVNQSPEVTAAQLDRVSTTLGRTLAGATDVPGFTYKRAQVLGFKGQPLIQMAYLAQDGAPMALCILKSEDPDSFQTMRLEGLEAASWSDGEFAYLLIGGQDKAQISAAARHLKSAL